MKQRRDLVGGWKPGLSRADRERDLDFGGLAVMDRSLEAACDGHVPRTTNACPLRVHRWLTAHRWPTEEHSVDSGWCCLGRWVGGICSVMSRRLVHDDVFGRLCRVRDRMHAHPSDRLQLVELARIAGLSRFHFLRTFRDAFGVTPHEYLTRLRLERAKRLLASEHGTVTSVCFDVGFSSLGSFSTLFAERMGCPPGAWRRCVWQVLGSADVARIAVPWCFVRHYAPASDGRIAISEKPSQGQRDNLGAGKDTA